MQKVYLHQWQKIAITIRIGVVVKNQELVTYRSFTFVFEKRAFALKYIRATVQHIVF